jgi:hypothetical protein
MEELAISLHTKYADLLAVVADFHEPLSFFFFGKEERRALGRVELEFGARLNTPYIPQTALKPLILRGSYLYCLPNFCKNRGGGTKH